MSFCYIYCTHVDLSFEDNGSVLDIIVVFNVSVFVTRHRNLAFIWPLCCCLWLQEVSFGIEDLENTFYAIWSTLQMKIECSLAYRHLPWNRSHLGVSFLFLFLVLPSVVPLFKCQRVLGGEEKRFLKCDCLFSVMPWRFAQVFRKMTYMWLRRGASTKP